MKNFILKFTRTTALAVALLAGNLTASFAADKPTVVKIGSATVKLVAPAGYVDCSEENDPVRNMAENFCPPGNRLLGVFASPEFRRSAHAGEDSASFDYALVQTSRGLIWRDASPADFDELKSTMRREHASLFARLQPEMKEAINRLNRDLQSATRTDVSFNLDQPLSLGIHEETSRHMTLLMLMRMQTKSNGKSQTDKVVCSMSFIRMNGKVIFVYIYRAYAGDESIKALKKFTSDWVVKLVAAND
jgi:hypothetical protein